LKRGEKISNLENASQDFSKEFVKTKQVVQAWSKMLNMKKESMHIL
jgi:hypothetical protein